MPAARAAPAADYVLVSWVGRDNDPFNKPDAAGNRLPGPTLTLLFDPDSEFRGKVSTAVLFHGADPESSKALQATLDEIARRDEHLTITPVPWNGTDPTEHSAIFEFLRQQLPEVRRTHPKRTLILHASPGTPTMHTVMVVMAETGYVAQPFRLVKTYRPADRRGRPPVQDIRLGIETYYKVFEASRVAAAKRDDVPGADPRNLRSPRMLNLFESARRVARLDVPVLILGERGTGKSTLATWIRSISPFRKAELDADPLAVACGQYSTETMRSELFGHVKGSFTGALSDHKGLLASAHGDTLFLDEIGDVSHDVQRLLIKAIEERRFQRFGDTKSVQSRFRLITATNRSLAELAERLEPDFFDRISHFRLTVPPLREVPEELPGFWSRACMTCSRAGVDASLMSPAAEKALLERLEGHPMPGNWRDLQRLAWHLIAYLSDPEKPLAPNDAIARALAEIAPPGAAARPLHTTLAKAFAIGQSLDLALAPEVTHVGTKPFIGDLQAWLARELPAFAKARGLALGAACDVSDRTLRAWKNTSAEPED